MLLTLVSFSAFGAAQNQWYENIPGRNYSWRELQLQRAIIRNQQKIMNPEKELQGQGVDFTGVTEVTTSDTTPPVKTYKVYIRGCGKVDLPDKGEEEMKKLSTGVSVRLRFKGGRSCEVQDWDKN